MHDTEPEDVTQTFLGERHLKNGRRRVAAPAALAKVKQQVADAFIGAMTSEALNLIQKTQLVQSGLLVQAVDELHPGWALLLHGLANGLGVDKMDCGDRDDSDRRSMVRSTPQPQRIAWQQEVEDLPSPVGQPSDAGGPTFHDDERAGKIMFSEDQLTCGRRRKRLQA
ncbi:hypothetical protein ASE17_19755 [Phenylobacterium sp. Root77]|nr:hypothetical protein ASC73_17850 [Phenylobacterium sp. Root1277]KQW89688.1 hypothetical protein ASC79_18755 [Phenylobacterium sp. Root1290]KRC43444.1 hypothetical protein ASE17_19755 [Phenylobacterium sp. Root77]